MGSDQDAERAARVQQLAGKLLRRIRAEATETAGLSITQDWALSLLIGQPMTGAELARAQGVRAQSMGTATAGLEAEGLIRREPDPSDGRRVLLRPTAAGIEAYERSRQRKREWLERLLADFDAADLRDLDAGLDVLERIAGS